MVQITVLSREDYPNFTDEDFLPLEILLKIQTPVVLGFPFIHFDGLIAHLLARLILGQNYYTLPSKDPMPIIANLPMPIASLSFRNKQLFRASASQFNLSPQKFAQLTTIYKRFEETQVHTIQTKKKKVRTNAGIYKNYAFQIPYLPATECRFYCLGHKEAREKLLEHLPGLGKKVLYGYGALGTIIVKRIKEDYSFVKNDLATRSLPVDLLEKTNDIVNLTWCPPYWDKSNITRCAPPGAEVTVKQTYR